MIAVRSNISFSVVNHLDFNLPKDPSTSVAIIKIKLPALVVAAVYNPPNVLLDTEIIDFISNFRSTYIIGADFNAKHTSWNNSNSNRSGFKLYRHFNANPYNILFPKNPTFKGPVGLPSTLDIFLTNSLHEFNVNTLDTAVTEHLPVLLSATDKIQIPPNSKFETDWDTYNERAAKFRYKTEFKTTAEIDEQIATLTSFLTAIYRRSTICTPATLKKPAYWDDSLLLSLVRYRRKYRKKWQLTGHYFFKTLCNSFSKDINQRIRVLRAEEFSARLKTLSKTDPTFWRSYKVLKNQKTIIPPLEVNDKILTSDFDKAEALAKAFAEVHRTATLPKSHLEDTVLRTNREFVATKHDTADPACRVELNEIRTALRRLKNNKAPGPDRIASYMIKYAGEKVLLQLFYLFNECYRLSYFPDAWKVARVCAVPKPGKPKKNLDSYRPISLLPIIGKVFERCILCYLSHVLFQKKVIINQQFGFREAHSTTQQLVRVSQILTHEHNVNRFSGLLLLDLSKAFDSVWHQGLIYKLIMFGCAPSFVRLMISYLENRYIYTSINGSESERHPVLAGVPQGSILGPSLFNIYINDIPTTKSCQLALYADDTILIASSYQPRKLHKYLQQYSDLIEDFFSSWKLKLNASKTEAMFVAPRSLRVARRGPPPTLKVAGTVVPWSSKVKYLGVLIDSKLTWVPAVRDRLQKANKAFQASEDLLAPNSDLILPLRLNLYKICIRPIITYGAHVWTSTNKGELKHLKTFQNKILKFILNKPHRTPTEEICRLAGVPPLKTHINELILNYQPLNHLNPLVDVTGKYDRNRIPYKIRKKFPLTVIE